MLAHPTVEEHGTIIYDLRSSGREVVLQPCGVSSGSIQAYLLTPWRICFAAKLFGSLVLHVCNRACPQPQAAGEGQPTQPPLSSLLSHTETIFLLSKRKLASSCKREYCSYFYPLVSYPVCTDVRVNFVRYDLDTSPIAAPTHCHT